MAMFGNQLPTISLQLDRTQPTTYGGMQPVTPIGGQPAPAQQQSPFDNMPGWKAALGGLLDSIQQQTGGRPTFIPAMMAYQQHKQDVADQQQQMNDQLGKQLAFYNYELQNPKPLTPTSQMQNFAFYSGLSPDQRALFDKSRQGDPYVNLTLPNQQFYSGPASGVPSAMGMTARPNGAGPAPGTIDSGYRFNGGDPADSRNWTPVGGASGNAGGGFRHVP